MKTDIENRVRAARTKVEQDIEATDSEIRADPRRHERETPQQCDR